MIPLDVDVNQIQKPEIREERVYSIRNHLIYSKAGFAAIVKIPSKGQKNESFAELPRTAEDEVKITDLISTMGSNGKIALLLHHERRLRKMGDELRYIHPLKFIGFIFSKPDLKEHMGSIFDDFFKRINFVKDYSQAIDVFDLKNMLVIYVDDFCKEVDVNPDKIRPFINNKDWEGLLRFLINN